MSISVTLEAMGFEYDEIPLPNRLALTSRGRAACPNSTMESPADLQSALRSSLFATDATLRIAEDTRSINGVPYFPTHPRAN